MTNKLLLGIALLLTCLAPGRADEPRYAGKPLAFWLAELKNSDPLLREEAIEVLADAGPAAREAVPQLEALLKDENRVVRIRAGLALWRIAGQTKPALAALTEGVCDPALPNRPEMLRNLSRLGPAAVASAPAVLELVDDADLSVRNQAFQTLQTFGPAALPALKTALEHKESRLRRNAADVLSRMGNYVRDVQPALLRRLEDKDRRVRVASARALWRQGQTTDAVATVLVDAARTADATERQEILNAVGLPSRSKAAGPILKELLKSGDLFARVRAANVMWDIDPQPKLVLPVYLEGLKDPNFNARYQAMQGIIRMGPAAREAVPALIAVLKQPGAGSGGDVYEALARIGAPSVPPLIELLTTGKPDARITTGATQALGRVGAPAVPAVLPLLDHQERRVRRAACQVVAAIGPAAKDAVPKLTALLKDMDSSIRTGAVSALGRIGVAARPASAALIELARDKNFNLRAASLKALEQIQVDPKVARPIALDALEDQNVLVRVRAVSLLWHVAPRHPDILPHALELLKQPVGRMELIALLGQMGPAAARAVPALTKLLADRDVNLRRQSVQVLGRIGPGAKSAVPAILEQLRTSDFFMRQLVLTALKTIRSDDSARIVPAVLAVAKQDQTNNRMLCLDVLAEHGSKAAAAAPWLAEELHRPPNYLTVRMAEVLAQIDPERARREALPVLQEMAKGSSPWRAQAAIALRRLKPDSAEALDALIDCVRGKDVPAQQRAIYFLGTLGASARSAAPALRERLRDSNVYTCVGAAGALWKITGETDTTVPVLIEALRPAVVNNLRSQAAAQLGQMGPAAKAALPELLKLRDDPDALVRGGVREAIQKIDLPVDTPSGSPGAR